MDNKIKISPSIQAIFIKAGLNKNIMSKYYEVDNNKKPAASQGFKEIHEIAPWDEVTND